MKRRGLKTNPASTELYYAVTSHSFHPGARPCQLFAPSPLPSEEVLGVLRGGSWETEFAELLYLRQRKCMYRWIKAKDKRDFSLKTQYF